ncbi:hypothetical protein [Caballeronia sp. LZ034LL]|uniref:hypothetical protein n=1 Tax=Caballeronia sp. LZ034LL TaxID=3038567 RepID=UPI0028652090|nr:hypothetical protein [Caballeronia sp. LZ034LL]MDR5836723.1 hypothetical protein [Caballeronia sp. LZ034LL]
MSDFSDFAYTPQYSGYYPRSVSSLVAPDGTLSMSAVTEAGTNLLRRKTQEINALYQKQSQSDTGGGGGTGGAGGGAQTGGQTGGQGNTSGVGSAEMLFMQKSVSEYNTMYQQLTSILNGLGDVNKAVANNTK